MSTTVSRVALYQIATLSAPLTLETGEILAAGTTVIFCPATIAEVVRLQGGTLAEAWLSMQKNFAELIRQHTALQARYGALEKWAVENGYVPPSAEAEATN